ncbi:MAG: hypothetical protein AAB541_02520, partial [Patescibacteria group bacterium]
IAQTRERYSRPKAEVEAEIREASGLPGASKLETSPPADTQPKPTVQGQIVKLAMGATPTAKSGGADTSRSTKRRRSRRRSSDSGQSQPQAKPAAEPSSDDSGDEHTIRLR